MNAPDHSELIEKFQGFYRDPNVDEAVIQTLLEENSQLIPTPFLLGHQVHWQSVVSQFKLDNDKIPDFAYVTKNTVEWRIVFIELERPQKKLFVKTPYLAFHSDTNYAIAQINEWKSFVKNNEQEVRRKFELIMRPETMRNNPLNFRYVLVIGSNADGQQFSEAKRNLIAQLHDESDIQLLTFDSLGRHLTNDPRRQQLNILAQVRQSFRFKQMHQTPQSMFAYFRTGELRLTKGQRDQLVGDGYDMDAWDGGELLPLNGKLPESARAERNAARKRARQ